MTELGESFDRAAEEYESGRPGWPDAVLDVVPVPPDATVLDLAAGTGKLTRVLARRFRKVIAVEPLDGMRAILEREVPSAESLAGRAEAIPCADASVDAVYVAQAFHWFANDEAVAEIARVLRRGGVLVAMWQQVDEDRPSPLPDAYRRRLDELRDAAGALGLEESDLEALLARGPFGALQRATVQHEQVSARDVVLQFASSVSWVASRDDRDEVLAELGALLPEREYRFPMKADVLWTRRLDGETAAPER